MRYVSNFSTSKLLFAFTLVVYLCGLQSFFTSALPVSNSLQDAQEPSRHGFQLTSINLFDTRNIESGDALALHKRATVVSTYAVPGVDECRAAIRSKGLVETLPSVFYTAYPLQLQAARQWAACFFTEASAPTPEEYKFAVWGRLADPKWVSGNSFEISEAMYSTDPEFPDDVVKTFSDMFLKNLSQAFAEEAQGDVYLVVKDNITPDNVSWDTAAAWGGKRMISDLLSL